MPRDADAHIWVEFAERDFRAAATLMAAADPEAPIICFLAQQVAEKYLKAFLVWRDAEPQRSHDLNALRVQCAQLDCTLSALAPECAMLNSYAVSPRYPMGLPLPGRPDAQAAVAAAERIRTAIRQRLGIKNV
jgi:HEPN domain-containing protein